MANYAVYNSTGEIIRTISCPEEYIHLQIQEGETYIQAEGVKPYDRIDLETLEVIKQNELMPPEPEFEPYVVQRRMLYPSVESQLDALWHAMDRGELPQVGGFYDAIKAVKDSVPKDNSAEPTIIYNVGEIPEDLE